MFSLSVVYGNDWAFFFPVYLLIVYGFEKKLFNLSFHMGWMWEIIPASRISARVAQLVKLGTFGFQPTSWSCIGFPA